MEKEKNIAKNLFAAAEELQLQSSWLITIAAMMGKKPPEISEQNHMSVLGMAIEAVAKQIALTSEKIDGIGGEL